MADKQHILLVDDDPNISHLVRLYLEKEGFGVTECDRGDTAIDTFRSCNPALVLLDVMLPGKDGLEVLKEIRMTSKVPVIMLTAKAEIDDRSTGLDAGADDYLTKPFAMGELLARLRSLTRRSTSYAPSKLTVGNVELDVEEQELACRNSIRLANKETKLMKFFMANAGKTLSTAQIFDNVWGDEEDDVDEGIVFLYVSYLREKLEAVQADIEIVGQRGQDYALTVKEASAEG